MCRGLLVFWGFLVVLVGPGVVCGSISETQGVGSVSVWEDSANDGDEIGVETEWLFEVLREILEKDVSSENQTQVGESRKRKTKKQPQPGFMERILPMMVTPFMISSSMIPMMLISIFVMLLKSAFIGKIGVILMLVSMLRNRSNSGGFFTHNVAVDSRRGEMDLAMEHYGYHGDEEYGAYVNRRRRR